jgi:hypothetical protein
MSNNSFGDTRTGEEEEGEGDGGNAGFLEVKKTDRYKEITSGEKKARLSTSRRCIRVSIACPAHGCRHGPLALGYKRVCAEIE